MRFLKILRYDLRQGLLARPAKGLALAALAGFFFFCFCLDNFHTFYYEVSGFMGINALGLSFGDVLLTQIGGVLPPDAASGIESFSFPIKWFFLHALILFFTLDHASGDLSRCGMQVITRTGGKTRWWLSKCLWNITATASYYAVFFLSLAVLSAATGKAMTMTLNERVFAATFAEALPDWCGSGGALFAALCVMPCVVGITLNLLQMTLALYTRPMVAYLAVCAYLMAGIFYAAPALVSNYALPVRSQAVGVYAMTVADGLIICSGLILAAVAIGVIRLGKMDLIAQEG